MVYRETSCFRLPALLLVFVLAGTSFSCRLFRGSKPAPPPPRVFVVPTPPVPPPTPLIESAEPGEVTLPAPSLATMRSLPMLMEGLPPAPPDTSAGQSSDAGSPAGQPSAAPAYVPRLGQILTAQQRALYNRAIDESIGRARENLSALRGQSLNREQNAVVARIRTFVRQAQEARTEDLLRAKSLAERAEILARDLLISVH